MRLVLPILACLLGSPVFAAEGRPAGAAIVPLAYVRRLVALRPVLAEGMDLPLPPAPPTPAKKRCSRWVKLVKDRQDLVILRRMALEAAASALTASLARLQGLSLVPPVGTPDITAARGKSPDSAPLAALARRTGADGALFTLVDGFGARSGAERSVWIRLTAYLAPADGGALRGPVHGVGEASTVRWLLMRRFQKTDAELASQAVRQAIRQLAHALDTGEQWPFARRSRVAVVPAGMPASAEKTVEGRLESGSMTVSTLERRADVLFQPGLGPMAELVDPDLIAEEIRSAHGGPTGLWAPGGHPNLAAIRALGNRLACDYVFISKVTDLALAEEPAACADSGKPRDGLQRRAEAEAEACLIRVSDGNVLWRDRIPGATTTRTEFVRHQPRIRRDDQCLLDALHIAYANLRFSLEDYRRRFEK